MARQRRTDADRIASVLQAYRASQTLPRSERLTMKELATDLGISTRTLRRIKNEPGHVLAPKTLKRMHEPLVGYTRAIERSYKKTLERAGVPMVTTKTPIVLFPKVQKSRDGRTTSLGYMVEGLNRSQIASAIDANIRTGGFNTWRVKVRVPIGVSLSGAMPGDGPGASQPETFYMIGPFDPRTTTLGDINEIVQFHMDAGRQIAEVYFSRDD